MNKFSNFPMDIVNYILPYDKRFTIKNGDIGLMTRISKNDNRYKMLEKIPKKYYDSDRNEISVCLNINYSKDYYLVYSIEDDRHRIDSYITIYDGKHEEIFDSDFYIIPDL